MPNALAPDGQRDPSAATAARRWPRQEAPTRTQLSEPADMTIDTAVMAGSKLVHMTAGFTCSRAASSTVQKAAAICGARAARGG